MCCLWLRRTGLQSRPDHVSSDQDWNAVLRCVFPIVSSALFFCLRFSVFQCDSMTERRRQKNFETTQFGQRIPLGLDAVLFTFVYSNQDRTGVPPYGLLLRFVSMRRGLDHRRKLQRETSVNINDLFHPSIETKILFDRVSTSERQP